MVHTSFPSTTLLIAKKYSYENKKAFGLVLLAIAAFLGLWLGVNLMFTNRQLFAEFNQCMLYFMGLYLFGCLSGAMLFSEFGSKPRAINFLMVPGPLLSKFLVTLIFGVGFFLVAYTLVFLALDGAAVYIANWKNGTDFSVINPLQINQYINLLYEGPWSASYYVYFSLQAYFILVSVWSPKYSIVRGLVGLGLLWVVFLVFMVTFNSLLPEGTFTDGLRSYELMSLTGRRKIIDLPAGLALSVAIFWKFMIAPLLWTIAYFKLTETQLR